MTEIIIADTDVLIDAGHNVDDAVSCLKSIEERAAIAISVVTQMELVVGCRNKNELNSLEHFLSRFKVLQLNEQISETAVDLLRRYRLSRGLLIPDALIAATALSANNPFVTKNERDYRFIAGLRLLRYPQPF